ncbi:MAG: T9SS type A sorting domain-containing protein, partial [Bacteroidales bacterium]|nr:T9SS type A sorting domain-containing protein [Bacteroidales bacterium]
EATTTAKFNAVAENKRVGDVYTFTINVISAVDDLIEEGITMFPNPANDQLTIKGLTENSNVKIMNAVGQLVYNGLIESSKAVINVSSLDNGVYILQIDANGKVLTTKFIKQ